MIDHDDPHAAPHGLGAVVARDHDDGPIEVPGPSVEALALVRRASPARLAIRVAIGALIVAGLIAGARRIEAWRADVRARGGPMVHVPAGETEPFDLDRREVTVEDYATCVARGRCSPPPRADGCNAGLPHAEGEPITCVGIEARAAYCAWVRKRSPSPREMDRAATEGLALRGSMGFRCAR